MLDLQRVIDFITTGVNQRGATLLLGHQSIIQYINMAALNIYFFEGRHWNWSRVKQSITIPASVTDGDTYTATTLYNIIDVQNICDDTSSTCAGDAYFPMGSDCDMEEGGYYWSGYNNSLVFARWATERTVTLTYYGYNLFTELDVYDGTEEILIPEIYLPALYHFTLATIYPHYTQYGEARETSAYQMGVNYLMNVAKSTTTVINSIRPKS